jgi:hypothetical protein
VNDVVEPMKASGTVASVMIVQPTTATRPPPMRSTSLPEKGIAMAAPMPWGAMSRPAVNADSPRATW